MKKRIIGLSLALVMLCSGFAYAGTVKEYSADMVEVQSSRVVQKMYVADQKMRFDVYGPDAKPLSISIVRMDQGKMYALVPQTKTYFELPFDKDIKSMEDISKKMMPGKMDVKKEKEGSETVSGYSADKFKVTTTIDMGGQKTTMVLYEWQAPEFSPMPVRTQDPQSKITAEMRNIKEGSVDAGLFELPAGYKRDKAMEDMMKQNVK